MKLANPYHFLLDRIPAPFREASRALALALVDGMAGMPADGVTGLGFLPRNFSEQQRALEDWHAALAAARAWAALQAARHAHMMTTRREPVAAQFARVEPLTVNVFFGLPFDEALAAFLGRHPEVMYDPEDLYEAYWAAGASVAEAAAAEMYRAVNHEVARAIESGESLIDFRRRLEHDMGGAIAYYETVYRTNVAQAYSDGQRAQMQSYPDVIGFRRLATRDPHTRPNHRAAHGLIYRKDDPRADWFAAPWGFNCFPAEVVVQGDFDGASRAFYSGKMIELVTKHGAKLSVTPNHPIVTVDGLVAAGSLKRGQKLLRHKSKVMILPANKIDQHQMPTPIEKVFRSLAKRGYVSTFGTVPMDFDGDAEGFDGQVDTVGALSHLRRDIKTRRLQNNLHAILESSSPSDNTRLTHCIANLLGLGFLSSASSIVGRTDLGFPRGYTHSRPLQSLRLGTAANIDAMLPENGRDCRSGVAGFVRECFDRYPGLVAIDEIESATDREFCGHVYDLHSPKGFIVAGGIYTSNCRCTDVPVTRGAAKRMGIEFDDNGDAILPDWPADARPDEGFK